jgi:hypothetical protein
VAGTLPSQAAWRYQQVQDQSAFSIPGIECKSVLVQSPGGNMIAAYIDEFIMICVGLWMSGVGFGRLQNPFQLQAGQHQSWLANLVPHFKWMGPLLIAIAIFLAVAEPA